MNDEKVEATWVENGMDEAAEEGAASPSEVPSPSQPHSKASFMTRNKWIIVGAIATVAVIAIVVGVSVGVTSNKNKDGQTGSGSANQATLPDTDSNPASNTDSSSLSPVATPVTQPVVPAPAAPTPDSSPLSPVLSPSAAAPQPVVSPAPLSIVPAPQGTIPVAPTPTANWGSLSPFASPVIAPPQPTLAQPVARTPAANPPGGTRLANYYVYWDESYNGGCDNLEHTITISCPTNLVYNEPTSPYNVGAGACTRQSDTELSCTGYLTQYLAVGCYGDAMADLNVNISLSETANTCDKELRTVDRPDRGLGEFDTYYGGSATMVAGVILVPCQEVATAFEHTCGGSSYSVTDAFPKYDFLPACGISDYCESVEECGPLNVFECANTWTACQMIIGPIEFTSNTVDAACTDSTAKPVGSPCTFDVECDNDQCVNGVCALNLLNDLEGCIGPSNDCLRGVCAYEGLDRAKKVCCLNGTSTEIDDVQVCLSAPAGADCGENNDNICASGACLFGVCSAAKLDVGSFCDSLNDCLNGACALTSYPPSEAGNASCCVSGGFNDLYVSGIGNYNYCTEMPLGSKCGSDNFCTSGFCYQNVCSSPLADDEPCALSTNCQSASCGYTSADLSTAVMVCCASGETISLYYGGSTGYREVCTGRPTGTNCGSGDGVCASGVCTETLCRNGPVANDAICDDVSDCASGACGLPQAANVTTTDKICCSSGATVSLYFGATQGGYEDICTGRPTGTICGSSDAVCASGVCTESLCREGPLANDAICSDATDCASGACGLPQAANALTTDKICCEYTVSLYFGATQGGYEDVCTGRPTGTICGSSNAVCASGVCLSEVCT